MIIDFNSEKAKRGARTLAAHIAAEARHAMTY